MHDRQAEQKEVRGAKCEYARTCMDLNLQQSMINA
jgi:hypothetical protein